MEFKNRMVCERDQEGLLICVTKGIDDKTASSLCLKSDSVVVEIHSPTQSFYRKGISTGEKDSEEHWKRKWKVIPTPI